MNFSSRLSTNARIRASTVIPAHSPVIPAQAGIQAINWHAPKNVNAYVTTRVGGVSASPYNSFNLAHHVDDHPITVNTNRAILKNSLHLANEPAWLNQTHSNTVIELKAPSETPIDADATFTTKSGLVCAVFSADCVPVLITNKTGTVVAAIHAGWKGLANGIIANTLTALPDEPKNCLAYIGPAICHSCYEVGEDVKKQFSSMFPNCFIPSPRSQHYFLDTKKIAELQLRQLSVLDITVDPDCTHCLPEKYYSYRRDGQTGRMAALIWLA